MTEGEHIKGLREALYHLLSDDPRLKDAGIQCIAECIANNHESLISLMKTLSGRDLK